MSESSQFTGDMVERRLESSPLSKKVTGSSPSLSFSFPQTKRVHVRSVVNYKLFHSENVNVFIHCVYLCVFLASHSWTLTPAVCDQQRIKQVKKMINWTVVHLCAAASYDNVCILLLHNVYKLPYLDTSLSQSNLIWVLITDYLLSLIFFRITEQWF